MHTVHHLLLLAVALSGAWNLPVLASDCPLDFSWSNFTTVVSTCSDQFQRGKCCRYINALIAVSVAKYAAGTGQLGVPPAFSDMCINSVSKILTSNRVPASATSSCGLGLKIVANYQCKGRSTVLEMLQAPNFTKVVKNCQMPLSDDTSCRKCINAGIAYLHHLIGADDNVTLSTCRNAAFVTLANQDAHASPVDFASCFFSVQNIGPFTGNNISGILPPSPSSSTEASPGPVSSENAAHPLSDISIREHHHPYRLGLMQEVGIGITVVAIMLLIILTFLIRRKNKQLGNTASHPETISELPSHGWKHQEGQPSMFKRLSYKETRKATCNFSSVIGRGGFGTVFKAHFSDGFVAAVKRMDKASRQGEDEFCKEVDLLGRLHHRHLVSLRGFCTEKHERFLMYEYMENGSLKDHLHSPGGAPLSWLTRLRIAMDVANALEYLHFYCDPPLCHRDIKSSNILLDENFVAKVADFGLAHASRIGSIKFEPVNTDIRGTPGYMDPEYAVTQELTEKSDVYSYGVLLLELVTGRQAIQDKRNLVEWSQKFMETEFRIHEMVDPLIANTFDLEQLKVVMGIAQWCTKVEGRARPSIKQVLRMLYEGLDPVQRDFMEAIGDEDYEDGISGGSKANKGKSQLNAIIPHSGDARCMSSSSTSRSYCSRSLLLENGSPQSPSGTFSV